jgi:hypothetical protein
MTNRLGWVGLAALVVLEACGGSSTAVLPPGGLSYSSPPTYYVGTAIQALAPTVTGSVTGYSVSPPLPAGLALDTNTGVISGTPTVAATAAVYTVTAQNPAGRTTFGLSVTVTLPVVNVLSGSVFRSVVIGTSVSVLVSIQTNVAVAGTLYATATDPPGLFLHAATVVPHDAGAYAIGLTTSNSAAAGLRADSVTVNLLLDPACQTPAPVPTFTVPFSVNVMTPTSAWPGDHLTSLSAWPGAPEWTTFQGNAAHTGYVPATLNPDRISTRWRRAATAPFTLGADFYRARNMVTTWGGQFFSAEGKNLLASSEHDGSVLWQHDFSTLAWPSTNPPAVSDNVVYIAAGQTPTSTNFFAFDAETGALRFQSPTSSQWDSYLAPAIGPNGIYTPGGTFSGLYRFDPAGNQLFFTDQAFMYDWSPAVDATGVYSYTGDGLKVVDPISGVASHYIIDPNFRTYTYEIGGSPVLGANGLVFAANYGKTALTSDINGNTLIAFDVPADSIKWQVAGGYPTTPAYHAGYVYAANNSPVRLEVRSEASGGLIWGWTPPLAGDTKFFSEVLLTDNVAFVCTNLSLYAIDVTTHNTVWSYPIVGRLALSAQGVLYVAGESTLTAFNVK